MASFCTMIAATELIKVTDSAAEGIGAMVDITKTIIWPLTVIILATLFRKPVSALIEKIHEGTLKGAGLEVTLKRDLRETERLLHEAEATGPKPTEPTPELANLMHIAQIAPRAAIMEAWVLLERFGAEAAQQYARDLPPPVAPRCDVWRSLEKSWRNFF